MLGQMTDSTIESTLGHDHGVLPARLESELQKLATCGSRWVACAPGTLDVMGGIAECTGSLTISTPTQAPVWVAVAPRDDQSLRVVCAGANGSPSVQVDWKLGDYYGGESPATPDVMQQRTANLPCARARGVVSAGYVLLESGVTPHLNGGFTVMVESSLGGGVDCREVAAVQAGTIAALARAMGAELDERRIASLAQRAQHLVAAFPSGIATHAAPVIGVPGEFLQVCCQPFEIAGPLDTPDGVTVIGIDCGARHAQADGKYAQARVTALMGREMIRRIVTLTDGESGHWNGYLARCSVTDYVDRFRDRLPTKVKGSVYLEHFGPLNEAMAEIEPGAVYKVRSRAEHHIYENDRVRQFAERLARAARTGERGTIEEAGELMYASHWSYGQRCGLGSIETDLLVNLLRGVGPQGGVFGARISGCGAGGTVVALIEDSEQTRGAIQRALDSYQDRTGKSVSLLQAAPRNGVRFMVQQLD